MVTGQKSNSHAKRQIVIVGGGGTGVAAAAAAVEACGSDVNVVVLEKNPVRGGVSAIATGAIRACDSPLQKQMGMAGVTKQDALDEFLAGDSTNIERAMLDTFLDNSGPAIEWLLQHGAKIEVSDRFIHMVQPQITGEIGGDRQVEVLYDVAVKGGARFVFNTRAKQLVCAGDRVIGVQAEDEKGQLLTYDADAVVFADGGFWGASEGAFEDDLTEDLRSVALEVKGSWKMGGAGDASRMGKDIGACLDHMDYLNYTPHRYLSVEGVLSENPGSASVWAFGGAINVTQSGTRFVNEDLNEAKEAFADAIMDILRAREEKWFWMVWDTRGMENAYRIRQWVESGWVEDGFIVVGETIDELAAQMGITSQALHATIDKYNANFQENRDRDAEFGRNLKRGKLANPLKRGPFYGMRAGIAVNNRKGGLRSDVEARVLDKHDNPIPGVFAAGASMDTLPFFGDQWLAGIGTTACVVWGRIAGDNAARGEIGASTRFIDLAEQEVSTMHAAATTCSDEVVL